MANQVNQKLSPAVDRMLQDISQLIGDISETDILNINDIIVIDKLKNYYIKYKYFVSTADTEEYELRLPKLQWYKDMIKLIKPVNESKKSQLLRKLIREEIKRVLKESVNHNDVLYAVDVAMQYTDSNDAMNAANQEWQSPEDLVSYLLDYIPNKNKKEFITDIKKYKFTNLNIK